MLNCIKIEYKYFLIFIGCHVHWRQALHHIHGLSHTEVLRAYNWNQWYISYFKLNYLSYVNVVLKYPKMSSVIIFLAILVEDTNRTLMREIHRYAWYKENKMYWIALLPIEKRNKDTKYRMRMHPQKVKHLLDKNYRLKH